MNGKDKRRAPRSLRDSVIEIFDAEGNVAATGRLIDFSDTGASFFVGDPLVMPERFRARLRFLDRGVLDARARVVWMRRDKNMTRYGIAFDSLKRVHPTGEFKNIWG
ncbi:MAG: PilZ domain-containing protein [Elusimicrobiales bacterium]|nr:PilZ domain-containing protein [Elusimicrobiales bacterium]